MKLVISQLTSREVQTKKGPTDKWNFNSGGKWYNAFCGTWNQDWKNGTVLEIPEDRIVVNTSSSGTVYNNISAPPKEEKSKAATATATGATNGNGGSLTEQKLDRILKGLEFLFQELQEIKRRLPEVSSAYSGPVDGRF